MGTVLTFPQTNPTNLKIPVSHSKAEFLNRCKEYLTQEDYVNVLCCIMDGDFYDNEDDQEILDIVNHYFDYKK